MSWPVPLPDPEALARALDLDPALFAGASEAECAVPAARPLELRAPDAARATRPTRCCGRSCRWRRNWRRSPASGPIPLAERAAFKAPGLLQKYHGRALLIATGACAVNCRYCFRREFPYAEQAGSGALSQALAAIAADASVEEVILSGGDPFTSQRFAPAVAHRAAGADPAHPPSAAAYPPAGGAAFAGRCRTHAVAARAAVAGGRGPAQQPRQRNR